MTCMTENCTEKPNVNSNIRFDQKYKSNLRFEFEREIKDLMQKNGFAYAGEIKLDTNGKFERFSIDNNQKQKDEWYVSTSGVSPKGNEYCIFTYGSWCTGQKHTYKSFENSDTLNYRIKLSEEELKEIQENHEKKVKEAEQNRIEEQNKAAQEAENIWNESSENYNCNEHQEYLLKKGVKNYGLRYGDYYEKPALLIPFRDINGKIKTLQYIFKDQNGKFEKRFLKGGEKSGNFALIGEIEENKPFCVCEGYATGASIYEATGIPIVVAGDSGNIKKVIENLRTIYPQNEITIAADKDKNNVGQEKAKEAADLYNCNVILPNFKDKADDEKNTDFNDLQKLFGLEEVKRQLINEPEYILSSKTVQIQNLSMLSIDDESDSPSDSQDIKATINARRRAIKNQFKPEDIIKDIRKQHPTLEQDRAKDIAKRSIDWAKYYQSGCKVILDGIPKTITDMKSLNSRFAQLEAPSQPCIIVHRKDGLPITDADYKKRLNGEVVVVGVTQKGEPKYIAAYKFWEGNTYKHKYRNIVFTNKSTNEEDYNLFTGFGIKPKEGDCSKIINHIKEVICSGDEINCKALLDLIAWQVQNIGRASRIITILKSNEQQIGKGCFLNDILAPIYGNSGFVTSDIEQVIGKFNDSIRGKAFIFLDECQFSGNRKAADAIKSLSTATIIGIESKGVPIVKCPCAINLFLATNHEDAAHIEETDARYWVLKVSPNRKGDTKYFIDLYAQINGDGLSAFLHFLLNRDVKKFIPQQDIPMKNEAKDQMIKNSINPFDCRRWLEECCMNQTIIGLTPGEADKDTSGETDKDTSYDFMPWKEGKEYPNSALWTAFKNWQGTVKTSIAAKPTTSNSFYKTLSAVGIEVRNTAGRRRILPNSEDCLKEVQNLMIQSK